MSARGFSLARIRASGAAGAACGALAFVALAGCQRSAGFKQDQDYSHGDMGSSYYSKSSGKTTSERLDTAVQPKKRVVVLNFWNDTPVKQNDIGSFAADELKRGLFQTQRLIVPTDVRSDLGTEDFIQGDKVKVAQLIREGRRLNVSVLVIGRVTKVTFRQKGDDVGLLREKQSFAAADVELKLFDVAGGREIMATAKSGEATSSAMVAMEDANLESAAFRAELIKLAVRNAMQPLVGEVARSVDKLTWEGRIAKVAGNKVYINAGRASGLVVGDILKVISPGDDVYDPATGAFLGRSNGQLKGTVEITDFIGPDGGTTEIHTGGNFQPGDVVQLY